VDCPACGHANPPGATFCGECAARIGETIDCPRCGERNPVGQRYCNVCAAELPPAGGGRIAPAGSGREPSSYVPRHLAARIRADAAALEGERKLITVLFCDVVGSMSIAERLGAESWLSVVDRLFALISQQVHRFEGKIDSFTGDGAMALFGAPIAHEDHARRAGYAALAIRDSVAELSSRLEGEHGIELRLRLGLNSGEVVVGAIGDDLSLDYAALGHTIGLGKRMESAADPGTIFLTEHTARLVSGYLDLHDLGKQEVKGASEPLRVFALRGVGPARGALDVSRLRGLTPFVGRERELEHLEEVVELALAGEGQTVGLVGEPGVGKSRVCAEFAARCRERGMAVIEASAHAHTSAVPFLAVLEMLRSFFGVVQGDSDDVARERVAERLRAIDVHLLEELPLLLDFLGISERPLEAMSPEARQRRLLALVRGLVHAQGADAPTLIVLEDLQWVDAASERFLASLVEALPGTRNFALVNFRPGYRAEWMGRTHYRQLPLAPLDEEAGAALISELLGSHRSLVELSGLIRERAAGNPFFCEQIVSSLAERGVLEGQPGVFRLAHPGIEIEVPATVQAVLAARIDRLADREKLVLQNAAVVGREFPRRLLGEVVALPEAELDSALRELTDAELVFEAELYPESQYAFRHPLMREVAYGLQLSPARVRTHAAIARALQELDPDRLDEHAALIAQHSEAAGEPLEAARWHARAAVWAGFSDPAAAQSHWQRVRELDPELPANDEADALRSTSRLMLIAIGWRLGAGVDESRRLFEEGRETAERIGDRATLALAHGGLGLTVGTCGGDIPDWVNLADRGVQIAEQVGDPNLIVSALVAAVYPRVLLGRPEEALAGADRMLELTAEDPQIGGGIIVANPRAMAASFRALPLMSLGRLGEARRALVDGAELCRRWDRESLGWTHGYHCLMAVYGAEPAGTDTVTHARHAVEIAEALGDAFSRVFSSAWLGVAHAMVGEVDQAQQCFERTLTLIAERGVGLDLEPLVRQWRAEAMARSGEPEQAVAEVELALRLTEERGVRAYSAGVRCSLAEMLIERRDPGDAERVAGLIEEAEAVAGEIGALLDLVALGRARAGLHELRGESDAGERVLAESLELARRIDAHGLIAELEAETGARSASFGSGVTR
jgi:class 3 adenylate cyclase/tetratricopeptide (TPR) repeat protein